MKALREKVQAESKTAAPTVVAALRRAFGQDAASSAVVELARERARSEALNAVLQKKGCKTLDIEALLLAMAKSTGK